MGRANSHRLDPEGGWGSQEPSLTYFTRRPDIAQLHTQPPQDIAQHLLGEGMGVEDGQWLI